MLFCICQICFYKIFKLLRKEIPQAEMLLIRTVLKSFISLSYSVEKNPLTSTWFKSKFQINKNDLKGLHDMSFYTFCVNLYTIMCTYNNRLGRHSRQPHIWTNCCFWNSSILLHKCPWEAIHNLEKMKTDLQASHILQLAVHLSVVDSIVPLWTSQKNILTL